MTFRVSRTEERRLELSRKKAESYGRELATHWKDHPTVAFHVLFDTELNEYVVRSNLVGGRPR